jgi:hypothetical protein
MKSRVWAIAGLAFSVGMSSPSAAFAYAASATVSFEWSAAGTHVGWNFALPNSLTAPEGGPAVVANSTYLTTLTGSNGISWYNSEFSDPANAGSTGKPCPTGITTMRQYGCINLIAINGTKFAAVPAAPPPGAGPGARASGTLNVTDNAMTGTLTLESTTDVCIGDPASGPATPGCGTNGYNVRAFDGSQFGNVWYGLTTTATLAVALTGSFTRTGWEITGGTVRISDPNFRCQQGTDGAAVLCTISTVAGGFDPGGSHLSFGWDLDGGGAATAMGPIPVRNTSGTTIASLGGVLASLVLDGQGNISTESGEWRAGEGSSAGGCPQYLTYDSEGVVNDKDISCGTLKAGTLAITGTAVAVDDDPDPFTFNDQADVSPGSVRTSNTVTITGIDPSFAVPVTVTGGSYSIGCTGTFTSNPGSLINGQTVCVRHTAASSPATAVDTTLTVGAGSDTFTSTTPVPDTEPNPFTFTDLVNVQPGTRQVSNNVTISGIEVPAPISVTGGEYSVGCTTSFTSTAGTIGNGQTVCVRHTSAATSATTVVTTLTVGGITENFSSTTITFDTEPVAFTFADQLDVPYGVTRTSNAVAISGINVPVLVTVSGGEYSIGCTATFTDMDGTISNNQAVCVRHTSASVALTATSTTLDIGGVSDVFTTTTSAVDTTPDPFSFVAQAGVPTNSLRISNTVSITGITGPATIAVTGGEYSINGGAFTAVAGTIGNGDEVMVRHTSAAQPLTIVSTELTVGGVPQTFTSETGAASTGGGGGGGSVDLLLLALLLLLGIRGQFTYIVAVLRTKSARDIFRQVRNQVADISELSPNCAPPNSTD